MTYPQNSQFRPGPPQKPSGSPKPLVIVLAAIGGLCTFGIILSLIGTAIGSSENSATTRAGSTTYPASTIRPTSSAPPAPVYAIPDQHNLTPELTVLEKKCYGSAGCNFEYELRLVTTTPVDFAPSKRYRVTVVIEEGTTWERIHSLTVAGRKADVVTGRVSSDTSTNPVATIQSITPL